MTLSQQLVKQLLIQSNKHILSCKINKNWIWYSKKDILDGFITSRNILRSQNVTKGDRVAFKGKNSFEWIAWNMATNSLGCVWVPMYEDQSNDYCNYIIKDCNPKIFLSNQNENYNNVKTIDYSLNNINTNNDYNELEFVDNELSTLIYTSGTTGSPKGVMLSNNNILSNIYSINNRFHDLPKGMSLNILPWAHIYSQTCELYYNILYDNKIAISSSREKFIKECKEVQPSTLYLVPRVLDLIKEKASVLDKYLLRELIPFFLVYLFGANLKYIFVGGAKLNDETRDFFQNYEYVICEGYGTTETSPMISVNHFQEPRDEKSIGKHLDDLIVEIVENEIQVSGPNVMMGYWNNIEATNKCLVKRNNKIWYKTGDSGIMQNGFLYYQGRINDNYKLSNGKFVNVEQVENIVKQYVKHNIILFGENMKNNELISTKEISINKLKKINNNLDSYLRIQKIHIISEEELRMFLTPKMSVKRKQLIDYIKKRC